MDDKVLQQMKADNYALGCDLSHHNEVDSFHAIVDAGLSFVILKATEGAAYKDARFPDYRSRAQSVGLLVSAYHYQVPNVDPHLQFHNYITHVRDNGGFKGLLTGNLDVEMDGPQRPSTTPQNWNDMTESWVDMYDAYFSHYPDFYTYTDMFSWMHNPTYFKSCGLWIASYSTNTPPILDGWDSWKYWQYSDHARVPGVDRSGNYEDTDIFNGTPDDLKRWIM